MATPASEDDLIARLVELFPAELRSAGARTNLWASPEVEAGAVIDGARVGREAFFLRYVTERQLPYGGGQGRWMDHQMLQRFERGKLRDALVLARRIYDRVHQVAFTGASGAEYLDVIYIDGPSVLTDAYIVHNLSLLVDA